MISKIMKVAVHRSGGYKKQHARDGEHIARTVKEETRDTMAGTIHGIAKAFF